MPTIAAAAQAQALLSYIPPLHEEANLHPTQSTEVIGHVTIVQATRTMSPFNSALAFVVVVVAVVGVFMVGIVYGLNPPRKAGQNVGGRRARIRIIATSLAESLTDSPHQEEVMIWLPADN